uniref:Primosomal protein n=1 Tax=Globodera pallida TaxID=36090 RepID=A0A183C1U6_GLOPA
MSLTFDEEDTSGSDFDLDFTEGEQDDDDYSDYGEYFEDLDAFREDDPLALGNDYIGTGAGGVPESGDRGSDFDLDFTEGEQDDDDYSDYGKYFEDFDAFREDDPLALGNDYIGTAADGVPESVMVH